MTISWKDLEVGHAAPVLVGTPLTITDFVRYQGASGDLNPIHHDAEFAQRAGYPEPFAVGMRQAGVLGVYVTEWLGTGNIRRLKVRFREQAWPGDVITYAGTVRAKREAGGERLVDVELVATKQTGAVHLDGEATFVVPA